MGLLPIEFTDCLTDSPFFRENLHAHEKELDLTSSQIKGLLREVKELLSAAAALSRAQRNVANSLSNFKFECIGGSQTDDEIVIARSLQEFGRYLSSIEDERDRMLDRASATFIKPIENFRRDHIGSVKEGRKKFEKETAKFCQNLERHLNLSTKKSENHLQEADATLEMEQRYYIQASLEYVCKLQEVQERKKFEFVETILSFMYGWLTFYHQGHEVAKEFKSFMTELQIRLQRTRENNEATQNETQNLMNKMLEIRKTRPQDPGCLNKMYTREGYLFLIEKKAFGNITSSKTFCQYQKESRRFTMIPYNQTVGKITTTDTITLKECIRRMSDSIDKRFCFDVIPVDKQSVYTFQALSEEDRKLWLDAMDGKDPIQITNNTVLGKSLPNIKQEEYFLDELGFAFVRKCIESIESRGLEDQGLYRVGGVNSKVTKLLHMALDRRKLNESGEITFDVENPDEWEIRTVTSALKNYFRNLPEPLMSFRLHNAFIAAAKQESKEKRVDDVHDLVHRLPKLNFDMLHLLMLHLSKVAAKSNKNLMNVCNLGVCFGPTLLRPEEETVAAIMDIKFGNVVVEILIENCDKIFNTKPSEFKHSHGFFGQNHSQPIASVVPNINHGMYEVDGNQDNNFYIRVGSGFNDSQSNNQGSFASAPNRSGFYSSQVYRSNSHDQLSQSQQVQFRSLNRPNFHQILSHQHSSGLLSYPSTPNIYQPVHRFMTSQSANPTSISRAPRPLAVFNPLNSQTNVNQNSENLKQKLSASLDGQNNHQNALMILPQQQSSPRSSPANTLISSNFNLYGSESKHSQPAQSHLNNSCPINSGSLVSNNFGLPSSIEGGRKVRTLYACVGENASELTFEPNTLIFNVRPSREPGWLEGCYNGKIGLIPENYVKYID